MRWTTRLGRDMYGTLLAMHDAFGEVCTVGFGPLRAVYLFGADANQALFAQGADTVSWHDAMASLIAVDGETAIVVSDGADHTRRRAVVQPAFGRRKLDDTIDLIRGEAADTFATWTPGSHHDAYAEMRTCVRRIVVRALFGDDLGAQADAVGEHLDEVMRYVNRPPWRRLDRNWPGTPYRRAMRARENVDRVVYAEISRRRHLDDLDQRVDLLSALIAAQDTDGTLSDTEVRDQVISLIAAGYDTTSAAAAWMIQFLAANGAVRTELIREVDAVVGRAPVTNEHLRAMPWLNGVVSEALRLGSPAYVAGRRIEAPFDVLGHELPAGPLCFYSPYVTHRMATHWPNPEAFRPGRWIDGHPDHHTVDAGAWVPFGGGARRCLGFAFAITELKVLAVELVRAVGDTLTADRPNISPTGFVSMAPDGGAHVTVAPRASIGHRERFVG